MDVDPESVNVLVVGDCNSGKTSFLSRLRGERSNLIYTPSTEIETKYYFEYISIKRKKERRYFHFFNIPGDFSKIDEYRTSFLDKDFVLIFVDLESYTSLDNVGKWIDEILLIYPKDSVLMVGCKKNSSLRKITSTKFSSFCKDEEILHVEISNEDESYLNIFKKLL